MTLSLIGSHGALSGAGPARLAAGRHLAAPSCWKFASRRDGWLVGVRPHALAEGQDRLQVHGAWRGPMKLVERDGLIEDCAEFFVGRHGLAFGLDEDSAAAADCLVSELLELPCLLDPEQIAEGWTPPAPELLASWLNDAGHEPAIDKDKNLRLTIKRRGCDGQVRVERGPDRLRLSLPLGRWDNLDPQVFQAMQRLTCFANDRCRLARLTWLSDDKWQGCEAQVDLTGLPGADSLEPCRQQLWRDMLRLGVAALELVLRWLGVELPLLAEPRQRALVEWL